MSFNQIRSVVRGKIRSINKQILICVGLIIFISFHIPFENFLSKTFVEYGFSFIESTWYNDLFFLLISISVVFFLFFWGGAYIPSRKLLNLFILFTILYSYYRFVSSKWVFTSLYTVNYIKYADLLFLFFILTISLQLISLYKKPKTQSENNLLNDISIGDTLADELGYTDYANYIAEQINIHSFETSFAFGINAKWGSGKTSFIDLIKRKLKKENHILIDFNAWSSDSSKAIIKDFFDSLQEAIRPYHSLLAGMLIKYADKLVKLQDNDFTKFIQNSSNLLSGYDSLSSMFKTINKEVKEIDKKIVVFIDDLDRLEVEEIVEVIRIIRNTGNFYNTFFVVAYDKNYITSALAHHNSYNHEKFLEKIFQLEITLPYYRRKFLQEKLTANLKKNLPIEYHFKISEALLGSSSIAPINLIDWVETIRDVTRLSNSITLNVKKLLGEVDVSDFIKLEVLRLKHPSVYELLLKQREIFLTTGNTYDKEPRYQLKIVDNKSIKEVYLKTYIQNNLKNLSVNENEVEDIVNHIQNIFPDNLNYTYFKRNMLSVAYPSKFERYFTYSLLVDDLSEVEFNIAVNLSFIKLSDQISKWCQEGLGYELRNRFIHVNKFRNREEFEKIIKAIFLLANKKIDTNDYKEAFGYDGKDLFNKLCDYNKELSDGIYKNEGGIQELRAFIFSVFGNAEYPFSYESEFAQFVNEQLIEQSMFPITREELSEISINYFEKFCQTNNKIELTFFRLFWRTQFKNFIPAGGGTYTSQKTIPDKSKAIFKDFLNKDLDGFLSRIIEPDIINRNVFRISPTVTAVFDNYENFKTFLDTMNEGEWKYLHEFKQFYYEFEKVNFSQYVPFDFKIIKLS